MSNTLKQRRVLLVEPGYRNKYPPLGLMKLATYHRNRGDYVRFYKGDLRKLVLELYTEAVLEKFCSIDKSVDWQGYASHISEFIKYGRKVALTKLSEISPLFRPAIVNWLRYYYKAYRTGRIDECAIWDRICVTSLFTFYFKKTIETIEYCKKLVSDNNKILVGGVMASLIPDEVEDATGIKPIVGLLDTPGIIDDADEIIIDQLPPDYSILEEVDYRYPEHDGYYGYTSRGCVRKCEFCAVPTLEPIFKEYLSISEQIQLVDSTYGPRRNLLLLDNNVLASKKFPQIIDEIRTSGFYRGARFTSPNFLDIAIENLKSGINEYAYRRMAYSILFDFQSRLVGETLEEYSQSLENHNINIETLPTKEKLLCIYEHVKELYESRRNKASKFRYVDFNQGLDARLITNEKMALLATIPIKPLRIAFDSMKFAKPYERAIKLAAKYEIKNLSNYLLFNYKDKPVELYQRMRLNVELSNELGLQLYSFPMRYSPIWDENKLHHGRTYIGKHWNHKFIRTIQTILNATRGKVGTRLEFFKAAFGKDEDEFYELLYMPEAYIFHRRLCEELGLTESWRRLYQTMSGEELSDVLPIIEVNNFDENTFESLSPIAGCLLRHYQISYKSVEQIHLGCNELLSETSRFISRKLSNSNELLNLPEKLKPVLEG